MNASCACGRDEVQARQVRLGQFHSSRPPCPHQPAPARASVDGRFTAPTRCCAARSRPRARGPSSAGRYRPRAVNSATQAQHAIRCTCAASRYGANRRPGGYGRSGSHNPPHAAPLDPPPASSITVGDREHRASRRHMAGESRAAAGCAEHLPLLVVLGTILAQLLDAVVQRRASNQIRGMIVRTACDALSATVMLGRDPHLSPMPRSSSSIDLAGCLARGRRHRAA